MSKTDYLYHLLIPLSKAKVVLHAMLEIIISKFLEIETSPPITNQRIKQKKFFKRVTALPRL